MRRLRPAASVGGGLLLPLVLGLAGGGAGCSDNVTRPEGPRGIADGSEDARELECNPDRDGVIEPDELTPRLGTPVSYLVSAPGTEREVELAGEAGPGGQRVWDWSAEHPDDRSVAIEAEPIEGKWYEDSFPEEAFVVPLDLRGRSESIYRHDEEAFWLLGVASADEEPERQKTLLVYESPIPLYRFPLEDGRSWVASSEIEDGTFRGQPYQGEDTYEIRVDGTGKLVLPGITFDPVLRVRMRTTVAPSVGEPTTQRRVSFLFECFGEVARAVSRDGESEENFEMATEVRRFGQ